MGRNQAGLYSSEIANLFIDPGTKLHCPKDKGTNIFYPFSLLILKPVSTRASLLSVSEIISITLKTVFKVLPLFH
jgi:hypothetical protein